MAQAARSSGWSLARRCSPSCTRVAVPPADMAGADRSSSRVAVDAGVSGSAVRVACALRGAGPWQPRHASRARSRRTSRSSPSSATTFVAAVRPRSARGARMTRRPRIDADLSRWRLSRPSSCDRAFRRAATWGSIAYTQYGYLPLMQVAAFVGIWGITFLIAWFASTFEWAWSRGFEWSVVRTPVLTCAGVLGVDRARRQRPPGAGADRPAVPADGDAQPSGRPVRSRRDDADCRRPRVGRRTPAAGATS